MIKSRIFNVIKIVCPYANAMVGSVMVAYETVPLKARVRSPADQFFEFIVNFLNHFSSF